MNTIAIIFAVIAVVALLTVGAVGVVKANIQKTNAPAFSCSSCEGKCTAESNCGLSTCGAVTGGKCTCGK